MKKQTRVKKTANPVEEASRVVRATGKILRKLKEQGASKAALKELHATQVKLTASTRRLRGSR
jgi:hypothetical protein